MKMIEVCANSIQSALEAEKGGAIRVELCDNLKDGGTTPSLGQIRAARKLLKIQLFVIIRPRGGNFVYDDIDFQIMKEDIKVCGEEKCDGVVFGILNSNGSIDTKRNKELIEIAKKYNLKTTFHRAIDRSKDILSAMEDVINLGFDRILTSGGKNTAEEGIDIIHQMIEKSQGRTSIMPGSGISSQNIKMIADKTKAKEFHGTFSSPASSQSIYINKKMSDEYVEMRSDPEKIREAVYMINREKA